MVIRDINESDRTWLTKLIIDNWGSPKIVTRGKVHHIEKLHGIIAEENNNKRGALTYRVENNECELVTLNAIEKNKGVGTLLIKELLKKAKTNGWTRVWVITTNDNLAAINFYQKRGFNIKTIYSNSIIASRKLKPEIPFMGENGIPIRDEIELEFTNN